MTKNERDLFIYNLADDFRSNRPIGIAAASERFFQYAQESIRKELDRYDQLYHPDVSELRAQNDRMREALELIAEDTTDRLKAMQAKNALDNIGAAALKG